MDKKTEYRSSSWEAKDDQYKIHGYAVVFDSRTALYTDPSTGKDYGEVIQRNALDNADLSDVVLRFDHAGQVLARTRNNSLQLKIDNHGLYIEADLSGSAEARDYHEQVKNGLIDKMSFAFTVGADSYDNQTRNRNIEAIERLYDVALVTFPAYEQTEVSVRSKFEALAEPDNLEFRKAEIRNIEQDIAKKIDDLYIPFTAAEYRSDLYKQEPLDEYRAEIALIRDEWKSNVHDGDLMAARQQQAKFNQAVATYLQEKQKYLEERNALRAAVAEGRIGEPMDTPWRKGANNMETASNEFYKNTLERIKSVQNEEMRAAGTSTGMTNFIPVHVLDQYVLEHTPGAFYDSASKTSISGSGTIRLPIAALQAVSTHTENAEITTNGYVPGKLDITHDEYAYNTGYSYKGITESVASFEKIINDTVLQSMFKKMDGICLAAVAGLTYTDGTNAVEIAASAGKPATSDFIELAGYLGGDYLDHAAWFMNTHTYFNWIMGLTCTDGKPIFDPTKKISDQAVYGYGIKIDNQIPDNVIYFGDGARVHLNYGSAPQLNAWEDYDHNTHKIGVRCVAGAAVETGSFVKMYVAAAAE